MFYLSLDVEASGPFPGLFSLVSVGAVALVCQGSWKLVEGSELYVELKPLPGAAEIAEATAVHGLTRDYLLEHALDPSLAMERFATYHAGLVKHYGRGLGAAWPASFDLPYVGWYCQRFLGRNPLGHSGFDIASYALGLLRCSRKELSLAMRRAGIPKPRNLNAHNALADAIEQGTLLAGLLNHAQGGGLPEEKAE
ncbi:3'-5' exonuclease [bacterium CPR1]|nr:3'-5' exonuclease [bacterium CPR1]